MRRLCETAGLRLVHHASSVIRRGIHPQPCGLFGR